METMIQSLLYHPSILAIIILAVAFDSLNGFHDAIGLGTAFGGWRIVKTMGTRITKIRAMYEPSMLSKAGIYYFEQYD